MLKLKTISFLSNTQTRGTLRFRFILIVIINQINFSVIYRYYISFSFFNFSSFVIIIIIIIFFMTWSIILYDIETRIAWSYHELSSIQYSIYICAYFAFLFFCSTSLSLFSLFSLGVETVCFWIDSIAHHYIVLIDSIRKNLFIVIFFICDWTENV